MNLCNCCKKSPDISVKLPRFQVDEKLAFVERVCALLCESRFGEDRGNGLLINLTNDPEPDDCVFLENTPSGIYPSYEYDRMPDAVLDQLTADFAHRLPELFADLVPVKKAAAASARGSP